MVKMNGCAAIDSARPFRFLADKAAVAADFHLENDAFLSYLSEQERGGYNRFGGTLRNKYAP